MANLKDYATGIISTAPSPATSGTTLVLDGGEGDRFPATPFNATVHPPGAFPTLDNAEKIQVTDITGDTVTFVRAQGETTAKAIEAGWRFSNTVFADDIPQDTSDLPDSTDKRYVTDADLTTLGNTSGVNTGDQDLSGLVPKTTAVNGHALSGDVTVTKSDVGLSNVDNTSDATKNAAVATLTNKTLDDPTVKSWDGWQPLDATISVASGYNQGNKSFVLDTDTDLRDEFSKGARFKVGRSIAAPTQAISLNGSTQYGSKSSPSGITFTDDFTVEMWIKVDSYNSVQQKIMGRGSGSDSWFVPITNGLVGLWAYDSVWDGITTISPIPLGRWVHFAAWINFSAQTGGIYIDGLSVGVTNDIHGDVSSVPQVGNLEIGRYARQTGQYFDGELADVRLWSDIRTPTEIQDNMYQQLVGNEANLVGYWKLNGDWNDSSSNANHLTPNGSPTFVTDNPMKDTEYGIVTDVTSTQITVFTGTNYSIPNMTLNSPHFSVEKAPQGFPLDKDKWVVSAVLNTNSTKGSGISTSSWYNTSGLFLSVPVGAWELSFSGTVQVSASSSVTYGKFTLSTSTSSESDPTLTAFVGNQITGATTVLAFQTTGRRKMLTLSSRTTYYLLEGTHTTAVPSTLGYRGDLTPVLVQAECAYL